MEKSFKIYTYVDGTNDTLFPNAISPVEIFDFSYDAKTMGGAPSISASVKYPVCLDNVWTGKEYVTFNGEKYFIKQTPSSSLSNDDIRYKHDIEFVSERIILDNTYFFDVVTDPTDNDKYVSNSSKVDFYGDINEFAKRLDYSLKYSKVGYTVVVDAGVSSEAKMMSFEDQFFSQVLQSIFEVYEIAYYYVGKVIHIGFPTNAITHVFKQGANGTLLSINKTNANYKIINRITGVGSTDNIPYYYPNPSDDRAAIEAAGGTWITPSANLMPPIYRESKGAERFYNAKNKTYIDPETGEYYVFENEYVDGNPKEHKVTFDQIKPTIKEMINAAELRIDMFDRFDYDTNDNDEIDSEGNYVHPYFFGRLRRFNGANGFNLFDHAIDKGEMTISMTSGNCGGCNFTIMVDPDTQKNTVQVHTNGELLRDKDGNVIVNGAPQRQQNNTITDSVWIALKKDIDTFGVIMPNATNNYRPTAKSDTFVILNIDLPQGYTTSAENKLKEEIIKYLATNNTDKFNFSINLSRIFFAEHPEVLSQLNENSRIQVEYNSKKYEFYISSYSYKMSANEPLPQITIELTETLTINKGTLQTSIDSVKQDIMSSIGSVDFVKQGLKYFIRKDIKDYAKFVTFREGIDIANFESLLSGGTFRTDSEGKSYLEVDRLYVRLKAIFDNLEIKKTTYIGGEQISSLASMKCIKVEDREDIIDPETGEVTGENIWDYYRCYYLKDQEGTKIKNEFKVGDQAISRETNLASGSNIQNRYYWRLVVAIGDGYIDLSKDDRDPASDDAPIAGDDIVQLGNRDDVTRQKAIIQSTVAEDAPSIKLLAGINSFSLEGKAIISQGFDGINKRAKFSVFGETYIGNADGSSFIKYTPENGVEINAKLSVGTTIGNGKTLMDAISDAEQNAIDTANENLTNYSAQVTRAVNDLQDQIDGAIESFFKEYDPTLTNEPANGWETDAEKERHGNDTFTNTLTGKSWRWVKTGTNWGWTPIADTATEKALAAAAKAQDTADGKRKVFVRQPLNSEDYDIGDLWVDATYSTLYSNDILRCKTAKKVNEAFNIAHWELASKYTDDAKAEQALNEIGGYSYLKKALEQPPTEIKNGLILSSLISLGYNPTRSGFVTQSGLNGIYDATKPGGGIAFWSGGAMKDIAEDYPLPWDGNTPPRPENPSLYATSIIRMDGTVYHARGNFWIDLDGKVHCDPLSFFVGEDQVGEILTLFTPVKTGSAPNQKVAGIRQNYPFEDGTGKGRLYIGSHIISEDKDGILHLTKKDGSPASFYVTGGLSSKGYAEGSGGGGEGGASALYQLLDVIPNTSGTGVDGAVDKSVLTFDGTAGKWKAAKGLDEAALGDYLTTNKYATQGWVSSQGYLTQHQSLANYVTLNTAQEITGDKTFFSDNGNVRTIINGRDIITVHNSNYVGDWTRGLIFRKADGTTNYGTFGIYGSEQALNYLYIGQNYASPWITFKDTLIKSNVAFEALSIKRTGGTSAQFLKADGSIDSNSYLTTVSASSTYVRKAGDIMTGALTVPNLVISRTDPVKHIAFSRADFNYITAPANGTIVFITKNVDVGASVSDFMISTGIIRPGTTNVVTNGNSSYRWSNVYSVLGNFSGVITAGSHINAVGNINADGTITSGRDVVADNYIKSTNGWFQNDVAQAGLYNKAGDARWMWNGSYWYADKSIYSTDNVHGNRLVSRVATGYSPFLVNSSTVVTNLNSNYVEGYASNRLVRTKEIGSRPDYERYVILLFQTDTVAVQRLDGYFVATGSGNNRYYRTDVSIWHSRWSSTGQDGTYSCINKNYQEGGLKLITVTYQGKEWVAMDSDNTSVQAKTIYFTGDWIDTVQFTLVSYYNTQTSTVLNAEIRDSRKDLASDNVQVGGETVAYLSSNVASATKLQTARTLWGQSFDGTTNVTGELKSVTRVSNATNSNLFLGNSDGTGWVQSINLCASAGTVYWSLRNTGVGHFRRINLGNTENDNADYRLAIAGNVYINCSIVSPYYSINYSSTNPYYNITKDAKTAYFQLYDTKAYLGFGTANSLNITQDGKVGIGIGTTNPSYNLHVGGSGYFSGSITTSGNIATGGSDGAFVRVGNVYLQYDATNNAIKVVKYDGSSANLYATGGLSAKGLAEGSGGGGGGGLIQNVYGYTDLGKTYSNADLDNTFNAYTINQLATRITSLEGGSAMTFNTTGTGEFFSAVNKNGTTVTFTKSTPNYIKSSTTERDIKPNSTGSGLLKLYFVNGSNVGLTGGYADALFLNGYIDNSAGGTNLITFDKRNGEMGLHYQSFNSTTWGARRVVLESSNYSNYTVTKTGGGASGTWGIDITGNANSATSLRDIRTIGISGGATGTATSFNGTSNITIPVTKIDPSKSYYENGKLLIKKVVAQYITDTNDNIGIIKITLPTGWSTTMMGIEIDVYQYAGDIGYSKILVGGYNYATQAWYNTSVSILGSYDYKVRLGYDGSKCCILLGTTTYNWHYPKVVVRNVMSGYTGYMALDGTWSTSLITTESGLDKVVEPIVNTGMTVGIARSCSGNAATATNISNTGTVTLATATESNAITITQPSYTGNQPVKLLNFNWYNDVWSIGNIRNYNATSAGLGIFEKGSEIAKFAINALHVPTLVIRSQNQVSHIKFTRPNLNYISCDTSGLIGFVTNGKDPNAANSDVIISGNMIYPGTNNLVINGTDANRWKGVYSVIGNFTGAVTMSAGLSISGSVKISTDWIRFAKNGIGLYSEVSDARWFYNGTSWAADKAITSTSTITGTRLMSNVAQGTSPLVVTSTTRVENLNADLLDNYHASGIATANTVVIRDGNNYTYLKYINSSTNTDENGDLDQFIVTQPNDSFYRKYGRDYVRVRLNDFINNCKTLDLTSLDQNTYYPCSVTISAKEPTTINIFVSLNSGSKPSWSTHTSGFTMNLSWQVFGGGWGTTIIQRKIFNDYYSNTSNGIHPCGGIEQNAYASTEIVYLRGGAKYLYTISNSTSAIAINTNGYSWSSGSTTYSAPTISAPKKHPSLCYEGSSMLGAYNIYANRLQVSSISVDGTITAATYKSGKSMFQDGQLELSGATPYIDFHYGNSTADYTHRIIAETSDRLNITTGLQVNGVLYGEDKLNIGSTMLSGVKPTTTNTITNVFNASTVLAMELYTVNKDSAQPLFRWANNISTGYTTRYSIGSVRAVGDGFGQLRLWVGNDDAGTTGNWFALNNNGVVSTSTTYFETSNTGFKTGSVVFSNISSSIAEISSATNELIISGYSSMQVNDRSSGTGRAIPTSWAWRAGTVANWANFSLGSLNAYGSIYTTGNITTDGTANITRMLNANGGLTVVDLALFNDDLQVDGYSSFNSDVTINANLGMRGTIDLIGGTIRGDSSSKIICDGIGISAGNKESGCIISGNPNSWSIVLDHNDIQARNNGAWSILYINDYGGDVSITNSSATYSAKILSTKASTAYNNGALTVGGGVGVGGSVYVRNNVVVNGAVTAKEPSTSDIRLKDNIRDFNASLILKEIGKPFTFEWNSLARELNSNLSNEHQNFGVSAQRVKEVLPGFAFECYEGGYLGVKYERFMPIVMAAQLETMGEVEILKRRVKELEDEIKILKGGK